jgi:hypothetical protein
MKSFAIVILALISLVACSDKEDGNIAPPPAEMVGVWGSETLQSASSGSQKPADVCDGVTVVDKSVSTELFKVDSTGAVYDSKKMSNTLQPYRFLGTMDGNGRIFPSDEGRKEFLGGLADISQPGVALTPVVTTKFDIDAFKGPKFEMTVDLQFVTQGQTVTQNISTSTFFAVSSAKEKEVLEKAKLCLTKTKSN